MYTLYKGDCLSVMQDLPPGSVDLILTDPPYGTTNNKWDTVIDLDRLWTCYKNVLKPNGAVILTSQGIFTSKVMLSNLTWFKYKLVWQKSCPTNFLNAKKQPLRVHEDICVFYNRQPTYNPQMTQGKPYNKGFRTGKTGNYGNFNGQVCKSDGERYPLDLVYFKSAISEGAAVTIHPTQKPVALMEYLIKTYTNANDVVLDSTMGSGTTGVACANTGRKFIGIELDDNYFKLAKNRIEAAYNNTETLSNVG